MFSGRVELTSWLSWPNLESQSAAELRVQCDFNPIRVQVPSKRILSK